MRDRKILLVLAVLAAAVIFSCSGGEKEEPAPVEEQTETVDYVSDEISFGVFFDEEGTKRTLELDKGQDEFVCYVIVQVPAGMEIAAVQWQFEIPEGVVIDIDKYNEARIMSMGKMAIGLSERFAPCLKGPKAVIHTLTCKATSKLENATFTIVPTTEGNFLGISKCTEGYPTERASSYKAVINPR